MNSGYTVSTDKTRLDISLIHRFLSTESYWAPNIPLGTVERAIRNSLCFGLYLNEEQVGFARVITDEATFAYMADVFIVAGHRGQGLSKQLMQTISDYPTLQGLRRWVLATRDAHNLYEQFGFTALDNPDIFMQRKLIERY